MNNIILYSSLALALLNLSIYLDTENLLNLIAAACSITIALIYGAAKIVNSSHILIIAIKKAIKKAKTPLDDNTTEEENKPNTNK